MIGACMRSVFVKFRYIKNNRNKQPFFFSPGWHGGWRRVDQRVRLSLSLSVSPPLPPYFFLLFSLSLVLFFLFLVFPVVVVPCSTHADTRTHAHLDTATCTQRMHTNTSTHTPTSSAREKTHATFTLFCSPFPRVVLPSPPPPPLALTSPWIALLLTLCFSGSYMMRGNGFCSAPQGRCRGGLDGFWGWCGPGTEPGRPVRVLVFVCGH